VSAAMGFILLCDMLCDVGERCFDSFVF